MTTNSYTDLQADLAARWLPSDEQRADALLMLAYGQNGPEHVYTVQILHNKRFGFWTLDVTVEAPRAVFFDRDAASVYAQGRVRQIAATGGVATASYARHYMDRDGNEQAAVFEDILADSENPRLAG